MEIFILVSMGALGAFVKDILKDNYIVLPNCRDGKFFLGFLGSMIIGAAAGYFVDNNPLTAFLGGFTGYQIIQSLATQSQVIVKPRSVEEVSEIKEIKIVK